MGLFVGRGRATLLESGGTSHPQPAYRSTCDDVERPLRSVLRSVDVSSAARKARGAWFGWRFYALAFCVSHGDIVYHYVTGQGPDPLGPTMFDIPPLVTLSFLSVDAAFFVSTLPSEQQVRALPRPRRRTTSPKTDR